jgi:hypothetical protein
MKNLIFLFCLVTSLAKAQVQPFQPLLNASNSSFDQHFPYPVIFIHGLTSDASIWNTLKIQLDAQSWTDGGVLRFSLNGDNNLLTSNINGPSQTEVKAFNTNVPAADYYRIDFDCDASGMLHTPAATTSQSNQAAIAKQGLAVKMAISKVLAATGREKVILVGHSMGGLAARQYLQTPALWVATGKHKVAKVVTIGTPHGGSNATAAGLSDIFGTANEASEAVRDLRSTYQYSGSSGVFLFGGTENSSTMNDWEDFYNLDVNCNGSTGNNVIGLNQKAIDSKVDFSCIIGDYVISPYYTGYGDLIVGSFEAQVKNYTQGLTSESFYVTANHGEIVTLISTIYESMDEPDDYERVYAIDTNTLYNAFFSEQAPDCAYSMDYDDFRFNIPFPGTVSIDAWFTQNPPPACGISILKDDGTSTPPLLLDQATQAAQVSTASISVAAADYFAEFYTQPNASSWGKPYAFKINYMPTTIISTTDAKAQGLTLRVLTLPLDNNILRLQIEGVGEGTITITDQMGKLLVQQSGVQPGIVQMDAFGWLSGIYYVTLHTPKGRVTQKVVK